MQKVGIKSLTDNIMTFFSGTDTSTLQEEGSYKNNFVSLIVNNAGKYTAAITRHVYSEIKNDVNYTYEMFGDGPKTGNFQGTEKKECIEYFMMNVHKPDISDDCLDVRINEILAKKRKPASTVYSNSNQNTVYNDRSSYDVIYGGYPSYAEKKDYDKRYEPIAIPWEEAEFQTKSKPADINRKALGITMARLLTGSVTCNVDKINIDSWIDNYDNVYATKFADLVDYSEWLAPYMEYLMYHIPGVSTDIIDDYTTAIYANEIIAKIGKPKGAFTKELVDQLRFYGTD